MNWNRWIIRGLIPLLAVFGIAILQSSAPTQKQHGLKPLTIEEAKHLEYNVHKVVEVKPNKIGVNRIQQHLQNNALPSQEISIAAFEEEFITLKLQTVDALSKLAGNTTLPSSVDNSKLHSFPPIGDQGELGSCVGWGSTYYHATHELGLLNGLNNKNSMAFVLSPKWTYNLLNGGQDNGLSPLDAYDLLFANGAVSIQSFPYDTNYTQWDLNTQDWVSAISNRLSPYILIPGLGGSSPQNLTAIKNALNNGHVLTFATYIDSWIFTHILADPENPSSPYVGEYAAVYMNGTNGGHFMTIVGYDDNIWIDVNGNGSVDAGERGAFLIANSWGSTWGNNGFIWISYDAFLATSAVANGPSAGRVPAGDFLNSCVISVAPKAHNYKPSIIGEFSLSQAVRDQINVEAGISSTTQVAPSVTWLIPALANQGGNWEFDGTSPNKTQTATFAVDLSDLLQSSSQTDTDRYYLAVSDNAKGYPTTLKSFSLIDLVHQETVNSPQLPQTYDNSGGYVYIDYNFANPVPVDNIPPVVSITSPLNNATLQGTVQVTANAIDNVAVASVQFLIDQTSISTDTSAPFVFSVDTTKLSNGSHEFTMIATDTSNNTATFSITVNVQNVSPTSGIFINCGGSAVSYGGVTWSADKGDYSGPSSVRTSTLHFDNSVYQTERYGNMSYHFHLTNGAHNVTLKFAELQFKAPKHRVFSVYFNGLRLIHNLDLFATAGYGVPHDLTVPVTVRNGRLDITFVSEIEWACISGIQIAPQ